jgi:hypothetical protein
MTNNNSDSPQCGNCVAWYDGECHRHAPKPSMWLQMRKETNNGERRALNAFWPETDESDYCMEWVRDPGEDQEPTKVISS